MAYVTVSPPALLGARKNRVSFWEEPGTSCSMKLIQNLV